MFLGILLGIWVLLMIVFIKADLHFFKFIVGSLGVFLIIMFTSRELLADVIRLLINYPLYYLGEVTNLFQVDVSHNIVTILHNQQTLSYYVSYECSGVIEMIVFCSLLAFYPVYKWNKKIPLMAYGIGFILFMNIVRLLIITAIVKMGGNDWFFFTHVILSRGIFLIFIIVLYYRVFTKPHILHQKVGKEDVSIL